ncbi:MAG: DUF1553 domain-containing protein [Pirellulaceae bacterium]
MSPSIDNRRAARLGLCRAACLLFVCLLFVHQLVVGGGTRVAHAQDAQAVKPAAKVDFDRQVRPILAEYCFQCHGPDEKNRQADLRLDTQQGALAGETIVAGEPDASEIIERITTGDDDLRMPPSDSGRRLSAEQIDLVRRWIAEGAAWSQHWSFQPQTRPRLPDVENHAWTRGAVDRFVLARLEAAGLTPGREADKETLIRRVTLDLTGLPPTPDEIDAFLADASPDAYERVVDRLLASPRYGERMATPWLDAARYADTSGYQSDGPREMWRWRDWVIDALNAGMPFDQFTIEQIAGDLLPEATLEQQIATGFNRNHRGNSEGGIIPEEYAVEYVVDRVDTTATTWLGLTLACGRCHDHKYDPLTQRDFYRMFAYFNNLPEHGRALKEGNSPPYLPAPTARQQEELAQLEASLDAARTRVARLQPQLQKKQRQWEKTFKPDGPIHWSPGEGLVAHFSMERSDGESKGESSEESTDDAVAAMFQDGAPAFQQGEIGRAALLDGKRYLDAGDVGEFGYTDKFTLAAWIRPTDQHGGTIVSRMTDEAEGDGYSLQLREGRLHVNLVKRWLDDAVRVHSVEQITSGRWRHVAVTYDGSREARGVAVYLDGHRLELEVELDFINQSFASKEPLRIGGGGGAEGRFHGAIDEVRVFDRCLAADEVAVVAEPRSIDEIVAASPDERGAAAAAKLKRYFLADHAPPILREAHRRLDQISQRRERLTAGFPTVMVMQEMPTPRPTHVLIRGAYDAPGEPVSPGVPESLPALPEGAPSNRLGLARWLVDDANPLTARVAVNRYWQIFFGEGLVRTSEDFGIQGERPSHPELLDHLAVELRRSGWDVKRMHRLLVTSATYRQSSHASPKARRLDPENRLLSRGPRRRLSAQMVRDQALAASGLLVEQLGGPSVRPYQPEGLWEEVSGAKYEQDHGASLYRRSLYTYFKRTAAPPGMMAFDAAGRETCIVRPSRTNTPLQALVTLNGDTFVEAARVLAERVLHEADEQPERRLDLACRLVLGRRPGQRERAILLDALRYHLAQFRESPDDARRFVSQGESPVDSQLDAAQLAAYTAVTGLIFNLDEAVTNP